MKFQRAAVEAFLNGGRWKLVELVEVESDDTSWLAALHKACKVYGAKLVIAKLDRLSRDAHFLLGLQKAGVKFVAADMPEANEMVVGIMALVAQAERHRMISERTKAALQAAKARGKRTWTPEGAIKSVNLETRAKGSAANAANAVAFAERLRPVLPSLPACRLTQRRPSLIGAACRLHSGASGRRAVINVRGRLAD